MKSVKFLLAIFTAAVLMASCATTQSTSGEDYDDVDGTRRIGNRVYVDDPYYGTVVLERDPFTGRYYDVTNGIGYRGAYRSPYNTYRGGGYRGGGYYNNNNRVYRNNNVGGTIQRPSQPQQQEVQKTREEARKKILGN